MISSINATAALTLWAFLGVESATVPAGNVENPGKIIPRATLIGVLVVANYSEGLVPLYTFAILISTLAIFVPYLLSIAVDIKVIMQDWSEKSDYFSIFTAIFALLYCCWAISGIGTKATLWGLILIVSGTPIYWVMRSNRNK